MKNVIISIQYTKKRGYNGYNSIGIYMDNIWKTIHEPCDGYRYMKLQDLFSMI
jgi:hypothetical protein